MTPASPLKKATKTPLWKCPKCGHRFVTKNMWHSCSRYTLDEIFRGKDPHLRKLFARYVRMIRECGPVTVYAQKTRIVVQTRARFTGAIPRKHWLECALWLKRRVEHPLFRRVDELAQRDFVHYFRVARESDLDRRLIPFIREAYTVGRQEYQLPDKSLNLKS